MASFQGGLPSTSDLWKEMRAQPLFAANVTYQWRGEYKSISEYVVDDEGRPAIVPIQGEAPSTTFELDETLCNDEHHIVLRPRTVAEQHRSYSFGRGMDYWNQTDGKDVVIFHDQKVAQLSGQFRVTQVLPNDLPSPHRLLAMALSHNPKVWAGVSLDLPSPEVAESVIGRPIESVGADDADLIGSREVAEFRDLLTDGKRLTVARDIFYSRSKSMLPVQIDMRVKGDLATRWRLNWVPTRPGDPLLGGGSVRGHRLAGLEVETMALSARSILATVRYDLIGVVPLDPAMVAAGLSPRIPEGYQVIDIDPLIEANASTAAAAAASQASADKRILIAAVITSLSLVILLAIIARRRMARRSNT